MSDKDEFHSCNKCAFLRYDSMDSRCNLHHNLPGYTESTSSIDYDHCRYQNSCRDFEEMQVNQNRKEPDLTDLVLGRPPARGCPVCGRTLEAMHFYFLAPKVLVYICPPCDAYYDASLRALPNDEASLARKEYQHFQGPEEGKS